MNDTLFIDPKTGDIVFDETGQLRMIHGDETYAQNVRLTLQTHKKSFQLDLSHGTKYDRILGVKGVSDEDIKEVIREAAYQEKMLSEILEILVSRDDIRGISVDFRGRLENKNVIDLAVTM
jgi:hypothetical protein